MVIHVKGCITCGRIGRKIRQVMSFARTHHLNLEIKLSDADQENQREHLLRLHEAGLPTGVYTAIVVEDNGKVTRLAEWNS